MAELFCTAPHPASPLRRHRLPSTDPTLALGTCTPTDGVVVVSACGEIDLANRDALAAALDPVATDPATRLLVCDLTATTFLACTGLSLLLDTKARLDAHGATLRVVTANPTVLRVMDITGRRASLDVRPTLAAALPAPGPAGDAGPAEVGAAIARAAEQTAALAATWGRLADQVSALDPGRLVDGRGERWRPRETLAEMAEDLRVLQNHLATGALLAAPAVEDLAHLRIAGGDG